MSNIRVIDNFLTQEELNEARFIVENLKWNYGHVSNETGFKFWVCDLGENDFFSKHIFQKIEKYFGKKYEINRVYANGQTYGLDGSYHKDDERDNCYTFLMYLSDINHENVNEFDGHTLFKYDKKVTSIEPILNRCVLFKSNILHKGMAPSRSSNMLRISVAFKLREIKCKKIYEGTRHRYWVS